MCVGGGGFWTFVLSIRLTTGLNSVGGGGGGVHIFKNEKKDSTMSFKAF